MFKPSIEHSLLGLKQLFLAAIFGTLLLVAFVYTAMFDWPMFGLYRYDALLIYALLIQAMMIVFRLEAMREVAVIALFHVLAMLMELYLTSPTIGSWHYPEAGLFRINNVPLFAGFMYSAVGSFLARALRLFNVQLYLMPSLGWLWLLAVAAYLNFFTHHWVIDIRNLLFVLSTILFWRTYVAIDVGGVSYRFWFLPMLWSVAVLIWVAENVATFSNIWLYPSQVEQWHWVGLGKIGSWYLLVLLSLVLVLAVTGSRSMLGTWRLAAKSS